MWFNWTDVGMGHLEDKSLKVPPGGSLCTAMGYRGEFVHTFIRRDTCNCAWHLVSSMGIHCVC